MRKIIALILVLFSITYTQAQDWINNESTLLYEENLKSNENVQCIEEYDPDHLLTTTNRIGTKHYAFRLWENGNNVLDGFLQDARCIVSDIEILGDSVYFCGNRDVNGNQVGYIGRFNIADFMNNQNCGYEIMDINTASKLKKLVAYDTQGINHVVAIGSDASESPIIVELFPNSACKIFYNPNIYKEQLTDIAVAQNYVVIAGEDTGSAKITLTRFLKDSLADYSSNNYQHYKYDYTTIVDITPFMLNADQVKITHLDSCMMALTTTSMDYSNNGFYTMVSIFDEHHLNILNTQVIPHNDKMIYLRDTEYDSVANTLYVLEDNNLDNIGKYTSYILSVKPYAQIPYSLHAIKPEKNYILNDIIAFSLGSKFIGAGINTKPFHALFSKDVGVATQHCNQERILKPLILGQVSNLQSFLYQFQPYTISWQQNNFVGNNHPQIIECQSNY